MLVITSRLSRLVLILKVSLFDVDCISSEMNCEYDWKGLLWDDRYLKTPAKIEQILMLRAESDLKFLTSRFRSRRMILRSQCWEVSLPWKGKIVLSIYKQNNYILSVAWWWERLMIVNKIPSRAVNCCLIHGFHGISIWQRRWSRSCWWLWWCWCLVTHLKHISFLSSTKLEYHSKQASQSSLSLICLILIETHDDYLTFSSIFKVFSQIINLEERIFLSCTGNAMKKVLLKRVLNACYPFVMGKKRAQKSLGQLVSHFTNNISWNGLRIELTLDSID